MPRTGRGTVVLVRTTLDIDPSVLEQLRARQRREGKPLGQVASELLAVALVETDDDRPSALVWSSQPMGARVDLEDRDALEAALDEGR